MFQMSLQDIFLTIPSWRRVDHDTRGLSKLSCHNTRKQAVPTLFHASNLMTLFCDCSCVQHNTSSRGCPQPEFGIWYWHTRNCQIQTAATAAVGVSSVWTLQKRQAALASFEPIVRIISSGCQTTKLSVCLAKGSCDFSSRGKCM